MKLQLDVEAIFEHELTIYNIHESFAGRNIERAYLSPIDAHYPEILIERDILLLEHGLKTGGNRPVLTVLPGSNQLDRFNIHGLRGFQEEIWLFLFVVCGKSEEQSKGEDSEAGWKMLHQAKCTANLPCDESYFANAASDFRNRASNDSSAVLVSWPRVFSTMPRW